MTVIINGKKYEGSCVSINNGRINISTGEQIIISEVEEKEIIIEGDVNGDVDATNLRVNGGVNGDVDGTNVVVVGDVGGDIDGVNVSIKKRV